MIKTLKSMTTLYLALLALVGLIMAPLKAQAYEYETLHSQGAWSAIVEMWPSGQLSCAMVSNQGGVRLDFTKYQWSQGLEVFIQFDGANLRSYVTDLEMRVDQEKPWMLLDAEVEGNHVSHLIGPRDGGSAFITEIAFGNLLVMSENGKQIHSWNLSGSGASLMAFIKCVEHL